MKRAIKNMAVSSSQVMERPSGHSKISREKYISFKNCINNAIDQEIYLEEGKLICSQL